MKITKITPVGVQDMYDISVSEDGTNEYVLANGLRSKNTGLTYSADTVFIIGKAQDKDKNNDLQGYKFTLRVEKSRFIKEASKIELVVHYGKGILKYSGLLDIAKAVGMVTQCRVGRAGGWQFKIDDPTSFGFDPANEESYTFKSLTADVDTDDKFWNAVFKYTNFQEIVESLYKLPINMTDKEKELAETIKTDEVLDVVGG